MRFCPGARDRRRYIRSLVRRRASRLCESRIARVYPSDLLGSIQKARFIFNGFPLRAEYLRTQNRAHRYMRRDSGRIASDILRFYLQPGSISGGSAHRRGFCFFRFCLMAGTCGVLRSVTACGGSSLPRADFRRTAPLIGPLMACRGGGFFAAFRACSLPRRAYVRRLFRRARFRFYRLEIRLGLYSAPCPRFIQRGVLFFGIYSARKCLYKYIGLYPVRASLRLFPLFFRTSFQTGARRLRSPDGYRCPLGTAEFSQFIFAAQAADRRQS